MSKFNDSEKRILKLFQTEENRHAEEEFSQVLTENPNVRLAFINENRSFTDGRNIVVDPACDRIFSDKEALELTARYMKVPSNKIADFTTEWAGLKMSARAYNIHECLHIIYTHFPSYSITDKRSTNKARMITLSMISNIIEDAYIEAVGASVYDNAEFYLKWARIVRMFTARESEGTVAQVFTSANMTETNAEKLMYILDYMGGLLLYPMYSVTPWEDCREMIEKLTPLFRKGAVCCSPKLRHEYACKIFDELEDLIPECEEELDTRSFEILFPGTKTHTSVNLGSQNYTSEGKEQEVTRMLFTDKEGKLIPFSDDTEKIIKLANGFSLEYEKVKEDENSESVSIVYVYSDLDAANIHKGVNVYENHPKPDQKYSKAYKTILNKYRTTINTANASFERLLRAETETIEYKKRFGTGISSKYFGDVKKRYWYNKLTTESVPETAILFMIDGSGSMFGERKNAAVISSVILHEILKAQSIPHSFVEHRAIFSEPIVEHNVLIGFDGKRNEHLNLMRISADEGTREGLSLLWAEKYISSHCDCEKKIIIVISDGVPMHEFGNNHYFPPLSMQDTAKSANKIIHRGTKIIAIALDDKGNSCYDDLKEIYPETIDCTDIKSLTNQLLRVISRELKRF